MVDYKKVGSKTITGKKTPVSVYKKSGSNKLYVKRSGKMVSYVTYKKSFAKKLLGNTLKKVKKTKATPRRRYTMGGNCSSSHITGGFMSEYFNEPPTSETEKMTIDFNNLGKGLNGFMGTNNTTGGKNNKRNNNQKRNNNRNNNPNSYHNYGGYYEEEVEQNDKYENEQPKETYQNTMEGGRKKHGKRKSSLKVHKKSKKSNNKRRV